MHISSDHLARIPLFVRARVKAAHCTDFGAFDVWEGRARACYESAGLTFPTVVVKVRSPHAMYEIALKLSGADDQRLSDSNVSGVIYWAAHDPLEPLLNELSPEESDGLLGPISVGIGGAVGDALGRPMQQLLPVRDRVRGAWFDDERDGWLVHIRESVQPRVSKTLWEPFNALQEANDSIGMWWPDRNWVIACDRPARIQFEAYTAEPSRHSVRRHLYGLQLHDTEEPAISWSDGTAAWYEHGEHLHRGRTRWYQPRDGAPVYSTLLS